MHLIKNKSPFKVWPKLLKLLITRWSNSGMICIPSRKAWRLTWNRSGLSWALKLFYRTCLPGDYDAVAAMFMFEWKLFLMMFLRCLTLTLSSEITPNAKAWQTNYNNAMRFKRDDINPLNPDYKIYHSIESDVYVTLLLIFMTQWK